MKYSIITIDKNGIVGIDFENDFLLAEVRFLEVCEHVYIHALTVPMLDEERTQCLKNRYLKLANSSVYIHCNVPIDLKKLT